MMFDFEELYLKITTENNYYLITIICLNKMKEWNTSNERFHWPGTSESRVEFIKESG